MHNLSVEGLSKSYLIDGHPLLVLRDISLQVTQGEFISIVGPSGCGKSTLLRLIAGLDSEFDGSIRFQGKPVRGTSLERGLVFQDHRLFPWMTVAQNVRLAMRNTGLGAQEQSRRVQEHLELVHLSDFANAYPQQLSGGMAQRAALARALVNKPQLLLLDEPLGALDALTRVRVREELARIWLHEGVTMIMVTHDVDEAVQLSDRVVVMDARPGTIRHVVDIPVAHPREHSHPVLQETRERLLRELMSTTDPHSR